MQLGCDGVFVGSGIFKSGNATQRDNAIVRATTHSRDAKVLAECSEELGEAMVGISVRSLKTEDKLAGLRVEYIARWEVSEAFAVVVCHGAAAIAPGHALGSRGSRLLKSLVHRLTVDEYGVAALCNGSGVGNAMIVQRVDQ
ncbi:Pyridoxal 5'-phosphate synthase subunit snz1, partial [Sporothrix bragantina]